MKSTDEIVKELTAEYYSYPFANRDHAEKWLHEKLVSTIDAERKRTIGCAHCGQVFTPNSRHEAVRHALKCEKNPLVQELTTIRAKCVEVLEPFGYRIEGSFCKSHLREVAGCRYCKAAALLAELQKEA